jgi:hypothetical protein
MTVPRPSVRLAGLVMCAFAVTRATQVRRGATRLVSDAAMQPPRAAEMRLTARVGANRAWAGVRMASELCAERRPQSLEELP